VHKLKLIVNADDLGLTKGVNLGIIEAYRHGIVTSATLMVNMGEVQHALSLLKDNPGLGVGIHLVLTTGRPISENVPTLTDTEGNFRHMSELANDIDSSDIKKEFESQLQRFYSFGLKPSHIDSHHHVHGVDKIMPIVRKIAQEHDLPVRMLGKREICSYPGIKTTNYFTSAFYGDHLSFEDLIEILNKALFFDTAEIMTHPAFVDPLLLTSSRYNIQRTRELAILTDPRVWEVLKENNIELTNYAKLF